MAIDKSLSDFLLTGCAIVPATAAAFGQPEFALLSHVVLLFAGMLLSGMDRDAPFRQPERYVAADPAEELAPERLRAQSQRSPAGARTRDFDGQDGSR